jgi:UDP-N-acetylmuramate--alanine ligase
MDGSHAHLIGISGNGIRALADVLLGWGWKVTGSDLALQGHSAENLSANADIVIYSDAIPPENPEIRRAADLGIRTMSYFQALGEITSCRTGCQSVAGNLTGQAGNLSYVSLAVAGTHGKSTTTAMIGHILAQAGENPTVFCGAAPIGKTSGGRAGRTDFSVVEACEYRKNFLHLRPTHTAILGIEPDHFDYFEDLAEIEDAFRQFAESLPADGLLLYCEDCPTAQKVVQRINCRKMSFGLSPTTDWSAQRLHHECGNYRFSIFKRRELIVEARLPVPGRHNVLNALAAAAMCLEIGVAPYQVEHGLETLPGLQRRFEVIRRAVFQPATRTGQVVNLSYVADYAHHPTEVAFALETLREVFPDRRIWCIFQPHQTSRTARLLDELAFSLQNADKVIVADIFRAREGPPKPGDVTAADLARRVAEIATAANNDRKVIPVYQTDDIKDALATQLRPGDVIISLGAGDIHSVLGLGPWVLDL